MGVTQGCLFGSPPQNIICRGKEGYRAPYQNGRIQLRTEGIYYFNKYLEFHFQVKINLYNEIYQKLRWLWENFERKKLWHVAIFSFDKHTHMLTYSSEIFILLPNLVLPHISQVVRIFYVIQGGLKDLFSLENGGLITARIFSSMLL